MPPAPTMRMRDYECESAKADGRRGEGSHLFDVGVERGAERLLRELVAGHCERRGGARERVRRRVLEV